jgi:hypothetical protein
MAVAESALAARKFQTDSRIETVMDDMDMLITEGGGDAEADERARVLRIARDKLSSGALSDAEVGRIPFPSCRSISTVEYTCAAIISCATISRGARVIITHGA